MLSTSFVCLFNFSKSLRASFCFGFWFLFTPSLSFLENPCHHPNVSTSNFRIQSSTEDMLIYLECIEETNPKCRAPGWVQLKAQKEKEMSPCCQETSHPIREMSYPHTNSKEQCSAVHGFVPNVYSGVQRREKIGSLRESFMGRVEFRRETVH